VALPYCMSLPLANHARCLLFSVMILTGKSYAGRSRAPEYSSDAAFTGHSKATCASDSAI